MIDMKREEECKQRAQLCKGPKVSLSVQETERRLLKLQVKRMKRTRCKMNERSRWCQIMQVFVERDREFGFYSKTLKTYMHSKDLH